MGYSEVVCHICGVSFNVYRFRTQQEPRRAVWRHELSFAGNGDQCLPEAGCTVVRRRPDTNYAFGPQASSVEDGDVLGEESSEESSEDAQDFEPAGDSDEESLEWHSDSSSEASVSDAASERDAVADKLYEEFRRGLDDKYRTEPTEKEIREEVFESLFVTVDPETRAQAPRSLVPRHLQPRPLVSLTPAPRKSVPRHLQPRKSVSLNIGREAPHREEPHEFDKYRNVLWRYDDQHSEDGLMSEHVSGPGCQWGAAYNGTRISAKEMEMCQTLQCLVRKSRHEYWVIDIDDEDFEQQGGFFLSGLSDYMPSRDVDWPKVYPARHNVSSPYAENHFWQPDQAESYAMPFHPYCLEVYKRASQLRLENVDIEGLASWWALEANYDDFKRFPRDAAVKRASEQWWRHEFGAEFLVAHPLLIPNFTSILESSIHTDAHFDVRKTPFSDRESQAVGSNDCFTGLPGELRSIILSNLGSKDIANLRLSSRTFHYLPNSLWYDLIRKEMPWLWEAWSDMPYSSWLSCTAEELRIKEVAAEEKVREVDEYFDVLDKDMPEMFEQNRAARQRCQSEIAKERAAARKIIQPTRLEWHTTDWHHLYLEITRNWNHLKGLQNRKRIWKDCEEIVKRVEQCRERGLVPVDDVCGVAHASFQRQ